MGQPGGLGRRFEPDTRDRLFRMKDALAPAPVVRIPSRSWDDDWVGDQGQTSECVGFGTRGFLVSSPFKDLTLDAETIYRGACANDGFAEPYSPDRGSSVRGALKFLAKRVPSNIAEYRFGTSVEDVLGWLASHGPVVLGTDWYAGMFKPSLFTGTVHLTGEVVGGHCFVAVGYNDRTRLVRCVNSWGRAWGRGGRFSIGYDDLDRLIKQDGEAAVALKKALGPKTIKLADPAVELAP